MNKITMNKKSMKHNKSKKGGSTFKSNNTTSIINNKRKLKNVFTKTHGEYHIKGTKQELQKSYRSLMNTIGKLNAITNNQHPPHLLNEYEEAFKNFKKAEKKVEEAIINVKNKLDIIAEKEKVAASKVAADSAKAASIASAKAEQTEKRRKIINKPFNFK